MFSKSGEELHKIQKIEERLQNKKDSEKDTVFYESQNRKIVKGLGQNRAEGYMMKQVEAASQDDNPNMDSNFSSFSGEAVEKVYIEHQADSLEHIWTVEKVIDWEDRIKAYPHQLK